MPTIAQSTYLSAKVGASCTLEKAGSPLDNPFVYDHVAKELKALADQGLIEVVTERRVQRGDDALIDRLAFKRLK